MVKVIILLCESNEVKTSKNMGRFGIDYPSLLFSVLNNILHGSKAVKKKKVNAFKAAKRLSNLILKHFEQM